MCGMQYLCSVKPLLSKEDYIRMEGLALEFQNGIAKKLQFNLVLKSWWATNYVSNILVLVLFLLNYNLYCT